MSKQNIYSKKLLQEHRRQLRKKLTHAEAFLWSQLKSRQLQNRRFTKQHSIGNYIVDFYCASEKLIVELDGEVHNNPEALEYDNLRTNYLDGLGYKVTRFENKMVSCFLFQVLEFIKPSVSFSFHYNEPPPFS